MSFHLQQQTIAEAASTPGHALQVGVRRKLTSHLSSCHSVGIEFIPNWMVFCSQPSFFLSCFVFVCCCCSLFFVVFCCCFFVFFLFVCFFVFVFLVVFLFVCLFVFFSVFFLIFCLFICLFHHHLLFREKKLGHKKRNNLRMRNLVRGRRGAARPSLA